MADSIIRGIHVPESISPEFRECYARLEEQALLMNYSSSASEHPVPLSSAYASVLELVARDPDEWPRLWPNIGPETRHLPLQGVLEWARDAETRIDGFHIDTAVFTQVASRYVPHPLDTSSVEITPGMQLVVDTFARETHERWLEGRLREGEAVTLGHWETLTDEQKAPSINQAVETVRAMSLLGIDFNDLRPLSGDESRKLIDGLTRNAHEVWAKDNLDRGVVYGVTRIRDEQGRTLTHPDLVPYGDLSEREKEYDRNVAMQAMEAVNDIIIGKENIMAQRNSITNDKTEDMAQIVNSVRLSPWDYKFVRPANELVDKICRRDEHFCNTLNDLAVALYDAGMTRGLLQDYRDYVRGLFQTNTREGDGIEALEGHVAEYEAMHGRDEDAEEMTPVDKAVSICLPEDVLEKGEYFSRNKEYRGVVERILPELLVGYDQEDLKDFAAYLYSSGLTESQLPDAREYVLRWYGGDFYLDSGLDKTVRDMIPDNVLETGRSVYVEREQERIQNGVSDGRYKEFSKELLGIASDLANEMTLFLGSYGTDDFALALYAAGLKAEQLPEFREYIRNLPQCEFPDRDVLEDLRSEVEEFEYSELNPTEADYAENNRHKREIETLEGAQQEHEEFIETQLKTWLPDDVVEKGEIFDKLISNSQESRQPFDGVYKIGNGLWAGFNMVWEDLGSHIIMDSNCKRLHEGEIFTLLQDSFPDSRMAPGYHVDDNGILTAVTGHMDDNGKIVSDGLFVLDTKTGKSRSFDAKECSAQLTKALEEAEKAGLGMEFTMSACMDLWNGEAKDIGAAISAGLKEWDIAMPSDLYVSRSREDIIAEDRAFVNRIFSPEEMHGDLKIFCSDDLSTSVIKLWAGSSNGKDQDYFVVVDHREDKGLLVNGANYNNIRSCSHGVIQSLNTPDYYKGHEPYLSFFDPASRDTVKDLCSKVDKALGLCCDNIHQHVYFANISRAMERRSSEGEYLEIFSADRHAANFAPLFGEHRAEPVLDNMVYVDKFLTYSRFNGVLSGFTAEMTENGMKHGEPFMIDMDSLEVLYPDRSPGSIDGFSKEQTFAEEETQDNTVEI